MRGQQQRAARDDGAARIHHIDSVAHHFLSTPGPVPAGLALAATRDVAVASPGGGRAAACAAAGLAVAAAAVPGWGSCVVEDEAVAWSASTYFGRSGRGAGTLPPSASADLPAGVRTLALSDPVDVREGWVRWRLLGEVSAAGLAGWEVACGLPAAARPAAPRWRTLAWCATASDAAASDPVLCLSRLVKLLRPARLEFLVVPDAWDQRPGLLRPAVRRPTPAWRNAAHLQEVARVVADGVPASVRVLPDGSAAAGPAGTALLAEVAAGVLAP